MVKFSKKDLLIREGFFKEDLFCEAVIRYFKTYDFNKKVYRKRSYGVDVIASRLAMEIAKSGNDDFLKNMAIYLKIPHKSYNLMSIAKAFLDHRFVPTT